MKHAGGRPKRGTAITDILRQELGRSQTVDGTTKRKISNRKLIARQVVSALTEGRITFIDGRSIDMTPREWTDFTKWLFNRIDGPVPKAVEFNQDTPLKIVVEYINEDGEETGDDE